MTLNLSLIHISLAELHQGSLMMLEGEEANVFCLSLPVEQDSVIKLTSEYKSVEEENVDVYKRQAYNFPEGTVSAIGNLTGSILCTHGSSGFIYSADYYDLSLIHI